MSIGIFEQIEIQNYLYMDAIIGDLELKIQEKRAKFYSQSMNTRTTYDDVNAIVVVSFKPDDQVVSFLDCISSTEQSLEIAKKKKRYIDDYLNRLDPDIRQMVIDRYSSVYLPTDVLQCDLDIYAEILEINEAINFMYGFPQEIQAKDIEFKDLNMDDQVNKIGELLGV